MSRLRLKFHCDIEGEDLSDETYRTVEVQVARICEDLEARLAAAVKAIHPDVTVNIAPDPGDEWKGE